MQDNHGRAHTLYVGVDVAATTVTAAWITCDTPMSAPLTVAQTASGYAMLHARLGATRIAPIDTLVVLEATGSYWIRLATTLAEWGYHVSVINPKQAHHFAKVLLRRAKTDTIDAQTLARLGATLHPAPWTPPPAIYTELQQRLVHRDALITMRQQLRNQRHALVQQPYVVASVRARLESLIATLTDELVALDAEIAATLVQDNAWADAAARLQTITGVGLITTAWLLTAGSPQLLVKASRNTEWSGAACTKTAETRGARTCVPVKRHPCLGCTPPRSPKGRENPPRRSTLRCAPRPKRRRRMQD